MRPPHVLLVGLTSTLALAGIVAGCGGGDGDASPGSTTSVETTDALDADTSSASTVAAPAETDPPATEPTTPDPTTTVPAPTTTEASDDGECLVGAWVVTEQQMDAFYAGLMSTLEAPLTIDTAGSAPLTFASDGTYTWAPGFALTVEVAGATGTGDVSGTINGKWSAVDGVVTTFSDLNALVVSIEVNGVTFDGADLANGLLNSSPVNGVTYSCAGPTPVLDFKTADPSVTVPVTLTPA